MAFQTVTFFEIEETVTKLMAIERRPLDAIIEKRDHLESQKTIYDLLNSTLKTLQASLDELQEQKTFQTKKSEVSDTGILIAKSSVGASEVFYDITITGVAQAARVESSAVLSLDTGTKTTITGKDIKASGGFANVNTAITGALGLEGGETVSSGSFIINDITIEVLDSDTISTILSKITLSSAGVTAYYDEDNDRVVLEQKTEGSIYDIELGTDSTNFFVAMQITEAKRDSKTDGVDEDLYRTLDDVIFEGKLSNITTGYFTINNVTFFVDTSSDSLSDVLNRINSSAANASVFYDSTLDKVVMTSDVEGDDLFLRNDSTSNFLSDLKILDVAGEDEDGTAGRSQYIGIAAKVTVNGASLSPTSNEFTILGTTFTIVSTGDATVNVVNDDDFTKNRVTNFVDQFNNTLQFIDQKREDELSGDTTLFYLKSALINQIQGSISNIGNYTNLSRLGLKMGRGSNVQKLEFDTDTFDNALLTDRESVMKLFAYDSDNDGLFDDGGYANSTYSFLKNYTLPGTGLINKKKDAIVFRVDRMDITIRRKESVLEKKRISLTEQFTAVNRALQIMEIQIQRMNAILSASLQLVSGQYLL